MIGEINRFDGNMWWYVYKICYNLFILGFLSCNKVFQNEDIKIVMITNISSKNFGHNCSNVESIVFEYIQ